MASKIKIISSGSTIDLCATLNYRQSEHVTWKKAIYTSEEVKAREHVTLADSGEIIATGLSCRYTFSKKEEGKYIRFCAYVYGMQIHEQVVVYYIEPQFKTEYLIESVSSKNKEVRVDDIIECSVIYKNQKNQIVPESKMPLNIQKNVKWVVKIENIKERLIINDEVISGGNISFEVPEMWADKNIVLIPYLNQYIEETSCSIKIVQLTKNRVVAFFIGGAGDKESYYGQGPTNIVQDDVLNPFNSSLRKVIGKTLFNKHYLSYYLDYSETKGALDIKNKIMPLIYNKKTYLYIIGHSLGAWNGAHLSKTLSESGYTVKMLITLDPVGDGVLVGIGSDIYLSKPNPKSDFWINIRATPSNEKIDDKIANFGKQWDTGTLSPDISHNCNAHHGDAKIMFTENLSDKKSGSDYLLESITTVLR